MTQRKDRIHDKSRKLLGSFMAYRQDISEVVPTASKCWTSILGLLFLMHIKEPALLHRNPILRRID